MTTRSWPRCCPHPDLATVREQIAFPLPSGEGNVTHRVILLLRKAREPNAQKLADLAAKAGATAATIGEVPHADGDERRSYPSGSQRSRGLCDHWFAALLEAGPISPAAARSATGQGTGRASRIRRSGMRPRRVGSRAALGPAVAFAAGGGALRRQRVGHPPLAVRCVPVMAAC